MASDPVIVLLAFAQKQCARIRTAAIMYENNNFSVYYIVRGD